MLHCFVFKVVVKYFPANNFFFLFINTSLQKAPKTKNTGMPSFKLYLWLTCFLAKCRLLATCFCSLEISCDFQCFAWGNVLSVGFNISVHICVRAQSTTYAGIVV